MPRKPKDASPVAFFRLAPEDYENLDVTVERMMRMIEERSRDRHQDESGDSPPGRRGPQEPLSIPLADE